MSADISTNLSLSDAIFRKLVKRSIKSAEREDRFRLLPLKVSITFWPLAKIVLVPLNALPYLL